MYCCGRHIGKVLQHWVLPPNKTPCCLIIKPNRLKLPCCRSCAVFQSRTVVLCCVLQVPYDMRDVLAEVVDDRWAALQSLAQQSHACPALAHDSIRVQSCSVTPMRPRAVTPHALTQGATPYTFNTVCDIYVRLYSLHVLAWPSQACAALFKLQLKVLQLCMPVTIVNAALKS